MRGKVSRKGLRVQEWGYGPPLPIPPPSGKHTLPALPRMPWSMLTANDNKQMPLCATETSSGHAAHLFGCQRGRSCQEPPGQSCRDVFRELKDRELSVVCLVLLTCQLAPWFACLAGSTVHSPTAPNWTRCEGEAPLRGVAGGARGRTSSQGCSIHRPTRAALFRIYPELVLRPSD